MIFERAYADGLYKKLRFFKLKVLMHSSYTIYVLSIHHLYSTVVELP